MGNRQGGEALDRAVARHHHALPASAERTRRRERSTRVLLGERRARSVRSVHADGPADVPAPELRVRDGVRAAGQASRSRRVDLRRIRHARVHRPDARAPRSVRKRATSSRHERDGVSKQGDLHEASRRPAFATARIGVALPLADPRRGSPHRCAAERGAHDAATGRHAKESAGRARSSYCECPRPGNVGPAARRLRAAHPHLPTAVFSPLGRHRDPRRSELRARGPRARRARATGRAADRPSRSSAQPHDGDGPRALGDRARGARGPGVARCSGHAASRRALGPVPRCHAPPAPSARDDELPPALRAPGDRRDRSRRQALVRRPGASARSDCELSPAG